MKNNHKFFVFLALFWVLFLITFVVPRAVHGDFATQQDSLGIFSVDQPYDFTTSPAPVPAVPTVKVSTYNTSWLSVSSQLASGPKVPNQPGAYEMRLLANNKTQTMYFSDGDAISQTFWSNIIITGASNGAVCLSGVPAIQLSWPALAGVSSINVYRTDVGLLAPGLPGTSTAYNDSTAASGGTYSYYITAYAANASGSLDSTISSPTTVTNDAPCLPTIDGMIVDNKNSDQTDGFKGPYFVAGPQLAQVGANWLNPMQISLKAFQTNGTIQKYFVFFSDQSKVGSQPYETILDSSGNPTQVVKDFLKDDYTNGILLRYDTSGEKYWIWDPYCDGNSNDTNACVGGIGWQSIPTLGYKICKKNSVGVKNCPPGTPSDPGVLYYKAFSSGTVTVTLAPPPPGQTETIPSWEVRLEKSFGSKKMYTAGYVIGSGSSSPVSYAPNIDPLEHK